MVDPVIAIGAAASTGLVGSLHCAAMCGPLAVAGASREGRVRARGALAYFGGRFAGYAAVGALMGFVGEHALCNLPVDTAQKLAVVLVAGVIGLRALWLVLPRRAAGAAPVVPLRARPTRPPLVARLLARLPRRGVWLGLATAILPCGMLLPAWALAAGTGSAAYGAAVMLIFAAASLPGLLLPVVGGGVMARLSAKVPVGVQAAAWAALAVWIAARGWLGHAHHHGG